jgi:hypothetical protein
MEDVSITSNINDVKENGTMTMAEEMEQKLSNDEDYDIFEGAAKVALHIRIDPEVQIVLAFQPLTWYKSTPDEQWHVEKSLRTTYPLTALARTRGMKFAPYFITHMEEDGLRLEEVTDDNSH